MSEGIDIGTESDERIDAEAQKVNPDVWAYVDDGEYATTWAVERVGFGAVEFETHRHEAGLDDVDGAVERISIVQEQSTEEFARELAEVDPELAIELAREYWSDEE